MSQLFDHYNVEKDDWHMLAFNLAKDHVPAMNTEKPRGAPKKWESGGDSILLCRVAEELIDNIDQEISYRSIVEIVRYKHYEDNKDLWRRYNEAKIKKPEIWKFLMSLVSTIKNKKKAPSL